MQHDNEQNRDMKMLLSKLLLLLLFRVCFNRYSFSIIANITIFGCFWGLLALLYPSSIHTISQNDKDIFKVSNMHTFYHNQPFSKLLINLHVNLVD